jgi:phosphatidylglycerophosphatase A
MEATVSASPKAPARALTEAEITAARIKAAQREAAAGGWPAGPSCAFAAHRKTFWAWTVATFFGAGFGKPGPGTWGSVAAVLIWSAVAFLLHPGANLLLMLTLMGVVLSVGLGVPAATIAEREAGRTDPGFVVIDEVAGQWITLLPLTFAPGSAHLDWKHVVAALLLFRIFDVTKPFPIRKLENLPEGWGILFDDVAAGLYAGAVLLIISRWI